jgi:hypothetical protein
MSPPDGPREVRYHVSPSSNRASIRRYGLDWTLMDAAQKGIAKGWAGKAEAEGIFLTSTDIDDARWFLHMGDGRDLDVWSVDVTDLPIEDLYAEGGWWICREPIPPDRLALVETWPTSRRGILRRRDR